jgi:hypothetical protein
MARKAAKLQKLRRKFFFHGDLPGESGALSALPHFFVRKLGIAKGQRQDCERILFFGFERGVFLPKIIYSM